HERWVLAAAVALITLLSAVAIPSWAHAMKQPDTAPAHLQMPLHLPANTPVDKSPHADKLWKTVTVKSGQTLSTIFQGLGLGSSKVRQTLKDTDDASVLKNIHPGDRFDFQINAQGKLKALRFDADNQHQVTLHYS